MANNKRREAARRQLERQLQQRQDRDLARRRRTMIGSIISAVALVVVVVVIIAVVSSGSSSKKKTAAGATTSPTATPSTTPTTTTPTAKATPGVCDYTAGGTAAKTATIPATKEPITGTVTVNLTTTQGPMTFTMNRAAAPCTVANFVSLVKQNYFNNTPCHRLVTTGIYVLQCGDPSGTGRGGPGYTIPDEFTGSEMYTTGVIAMANTGSAHTGGSQFFIVYKNSSLPAQYTIFGKVTAGLSVVNTVAAKGSDNANAAGDGKPNLPISLTKLTVS